KFVESPPWIFKKDPRVRRGFQEEKITRRQNFRLYKHSRFSFVVWSQLDPKQQKKNLVKAKDETKLAIQATQA
ncbi:hypothetical protein LINGRAHAP2_LOCUS24313, partial [Linum grandiflorum]